jgi:hypothetical protein
VTQPTPDGFPLTDASILSDVVRLNPDYYQVAVVTHLLKEAVDAGEVAFPIASLDALQPVLRRAVALGLDGPNPDLVPGVVFPVEDYQQFARRALAYIRFDHHLVGDIRPPK